jgi:hypothetical protein
MFESIPLEFLFFALPAVLAALFTLPFYFMFSLLRSRWPARAFVLSLLVGLVFGAVMFIFMAGALLFGFGLPGDENAGDVVVLFLWNSVLAAAASQVVYWFLFLWSGRKQ